MNRTKLLLALAISIALAGGYLLADYYSSLPADAQAKYLGRESCASCHQQQLDLFHGSHHDEAMQVVSDSTVLADFDNQTLTHFGITSRMFRDGDRFMVHTEGPDGELQDFEVKYTFGVEPLQQYMVEIEPPPEEAAEGAVGRVQVLRLSWDTAAKKWFYLQPPDVTTKLEPDDPLHWTGITQNWNVSCAECHSTDLQKGYSLAEDRFATTFSEIDVSCEACHGPGSLHVQIADAGGIFQDRHHGLGLAKLKTVSNRPQVETCAPCHSRRTVVAEGFRAGCRFDEFYAVQRIVAPVYHLDGQIRDEDYVYGSFLQSKMFHKGIRCTDCHDPHSTKLKHDGNMVCTSCHQHPSGKYDSPNHHFHEAGTAGAKCINCHMPHTTYMDVDVRHDHSFRVPRPDLSVRLGTPNACTACHLDVEKSIDSLAEDGQRKPLRQYLDWLIAAEQGDTEVSKEVDRVNGLMLAAVEKWYPVATSPPKTPYYADLAVGLAEAGVDSAADRLLAVARDATVPDLVRASAIPMLDQSEDAWKAAQRALGDADAKVVVAGLQWLMVRLGDVGSTNSSAGGAAGDSAGSLKRIIATGLPLLSHASHPVRLEAMRLAMSIPNELRDRYASSDQRQAYREGLKEFEAFLKLNGDRANGQILLGNFYAQTGRESAGERAFRQALRMDGALAGPRSSLAGLLEARAAAGDPMADSLREQAASYRKQEHPLLRRDMQLSLEVPQNHPVRYRFAMSCVLQRDYDGAADQLRECVAQQPNDTNYAYTLAVLYFQTGQPELAKPLVARILKLEPGNASFRQLAAELGQ